MVMFTESGCIVMQEWVDIIVNNGIAVSVVCYFCYMNYKFTATINESLVVIKQMLNDLKED